MSIATSTENASVLRDFSDNLQDATSFDEAMDVLQHAAAQFGFPLLAYAYLPVARKASGSWLPAKLHTRNFRNRWDRDWTKHGVNDPYLHRCFSGNVPTLWADVQADQHLRPAQRDCQHYISDHVSHFGLTVPIHLQGGQFAFVSVLSESDRDWDRKVLDSKDYLFVVSHYFHNHLTAWAMLPKRTPSSDLTDREIQCLSWAAQGKTAADIGVILDISPETVRVHLKHVHEKLNALNRPHAVAKAAALGLIEIPIYQ